MTQESPTFTTVMYMAWLGSPSAPRTRTCPLHDALLRVPAIDDADDARVDRRLGGQKRKRRFTAADEEDVLANTGADSIRRDERTSSGRAIGRHGLQHEQFV